MSAYDDDGERVSDMEPVAPEDMFLIDDFLVNDLTVLSGAPGAGKSFLAIDMVTALVNGESDYLGFTVRKKLDHVAFGLTDGGKAKWELKQRLGDDAAKHVTAWRIQQPGAGDKAYWGEITKSLLSDRVDLLVVDNMLGSMGDCADISESVPGTQFIRRMQFIADAGIPVYLLTHTAKAGEGYSPANAPIGARAIGALARGNLILRHDTSGRTLVLNVNWAPSQSIPVELVPAEPGSRVMRWARCERAAVVRERKQRQRKAEKLDANAELVERTLAEQPPVSTFTKLADYYADIPGLGSVQVTRKILPKLLRYDRTAPGWERAVNG